MAAGVHGGVSMNLWVFNRDCEPLGIIPDAESVIFKRSLCGLGDLQIVMSAQRENAGLLQPGRIVRIDGRPEMAGILTGRSISTERGRSELKVTGAQLKRILKKRVIVPPTVDEDPTAYGYDRIATSPGEAVLRHYVTRHAISPSDENRIIPRLILEDAHYPMLGTDTPWQARWSVLTDELEDICEWCGIGYNVDLDAANRRFIFRTLAGRDLTGKDGGLTRVTFSAGFRNVTNIQYEEDYAACSNSIYALGAGEDENQVVRLLYADDEGSKLEDIQTGWDRSETTISVGSLSLPDEIDFEAYHYLKTNVRKVQALTATINRYGPFAYRRDWDLGDIVTVKLTLPALGETVTMHAPITAITEVYERDGQNPRLDVTFGSAWPTLSRTIDRRIRRI